MLDENLLADGVGRIERILQTRSYDESARAYNAEKLAALRGISPQARMISRSQTTTALRSAPGTRAAPGLPEGLNDEQHNAVIYFEDAVAAVADPTLRRLFAELYLVDGSVLRAAPHFMMLGDEDGIKRTARQAESSDWTVAVNCYQWLRDDDGLRRTAARQSKLLLETTAAMDVLFGDDISQVLSLGAVRYAGKRYVPLQARPGANAEQVLLSTIASVKDSYDVAVPLVFGGLYAGYLAELCGMPTVVAQPKRRGAGVIIRWLDRTSELAGKRVLVIDDSFSTGERLRQTVCALEEKRVASAGILLVNHVVGFGLLDCRSDIPAYFELPILEPQICDNLYDTLAAAVERARAYR
jgi:hypothetical protein